jgi:hypothetical protein
MAGGAVASANDMKTSDHHGTLMTATLADPTCPAVAANPNRFLADEGGIKTITR